MLLGSRETTVATLSRTSCAATALFFSSRNWTMIVEMPSFVVERSSSMASMVLTISSMGLVTPLSISSTLAPFSVVVMVTVGKSTFGKRSRPRRW